MAVRRRRFPFIASASLRIGAVIEGGNRPGGLALHQRDRPAAARHEEIHFQPLFVAKVVNLASPAIVHLRLDNLRCDKTFKEGAGKRRLGQLGCRVDAQQMARETRVGEIDLGRFDQTFAEWT